VNEVRVTGRGARVKEKQPPVPEVRRYFAVTSGAGEAQLRQERAGVPTPVLQGGDAAILTRESGAERDIFRWSPKFAAIYEVKTATVTLTAARVARREPLTGLP
jgi:hypothetical protein